MGDDMAVSPRSREVVKPSTRRYVGRYSSVKNGRMIHWESKLERDQIVLLEIDPDVIAYAEQPTPFRYQADGKQRKYTPDFLVRSHDGDLVIEVKASKFAESQEWMRHLDFLSQLIAEHGLRYIVATEREIRREPRLSNANRILRYRGCHVDDGLKREILAAFDNHLTLSIDELENELGIDDLYAEACTLISRGHLCVDLEKTFGREEPLRRNKDDGK